MMSDDDYDELPPISVSSIRKTSAMRMPSAEELARGRAREAECERELRRLRERGTDVVAPQPDSSGSEGEAALAAAVNKLEVRSTLRSRPLDLGALLPPLLARLPTGDALADLATDAAARDALTDLMCEAAGGPPLRAGDAALCAAWLSAGGAAGASRAARRRARRALHHLLARPPLDDDDSEDARTLRAALLDGVTDAAARIEVADALAPAGARLHARLARAALARLLRCDAAPAEGCACAWAAGAVSAAGSVLEARALRAAGRVLRACGTRGTACAAARGQLRAALPTPRPGDARQPPDRLEVLVGASRLRLLFRE